MTPEERTLWLDFLKVFTRSLVQIGLYRPDHPQVKQALVDGEALLAKIHAAGADFSLTLDSGKLLVNGSPLLTADKLPNSLKNLFARFHLQTITFLPGTTGSDLLAICQLQAHKGAAQQFMKDRGIDRITLNEDVYTKVGQAGGTGAEGPAGGGAGGTGNAGPGAGGSGGAGPGPGPGGTGGAEGPGGAGGTGPGGGAPAPKIADQIASQSLENSLATLVSKATSNPEEQKAIMSLLMAKVKDMLAAEVEKAVVTVRKEKKKVENDMMRAEAVVSSMAEGVVVVDKNGNIVMMNPQAEVISGKPLAELSGKRIFDLAQIENQVVSLAKEIRPLDSTGDFSNEVQLSGAPGLADSVKKATAVIQNEEGKIVGSVSIPTDVARLKQMDQLQKDFIANMTHELRSPLTSIKAALELLSRDAGKSIDASRGMLNTAIRNTERLNSIITDILDFSKLQSGKLILHPEGVKPGDITKEAAESMKAWAGSKGLDLSVSNAPELPAVFADRRRTVQVLINLISNAIKFTPQGGTVKVSADAGRDSMAGFVFFSVSDSGCGIKKEDQAKVFEKFVQVAAGEKVGGTGLGLAITKAMVVMQGGKITLDSEPGRGSTFRVILPVYKGQAEQSAEQAPSAPEQRKAWWQRLFGG